MTEVGPTERLNRERLVERLGDGKVKIRETEKLKRMTFTERLGYFLCNI